MTAVPNKLSIALACRAAMQAHRKGKQIAFQLDHRASALTPTDHRTSGRSLSWPQVTR